MINKSAKTIMVILVILFFIEIKMSPADNINVKYISYVNPDLGFYKVTDVTTRNPAQYVSRTLTINQGDTVEWENDAGKQFTMTVVSDQKLFADTSLVDAGDNFSYTFNQAAVYTFYIKERRSIRQTIIVLPVAGYDTPVPASAITPSPVVTSVPTFNPSTTANIASNGTNGLNDGKAIFSSISLTGIMSIIVGILSIFITYRKAST